ncbi:hypothetical protein GCM10009801_72430 [Streptomyces albiaxialis]|uniref:AG2 protein n=1 Tax=Streptomyces albiaxialis TaxID=329523 RepID=A0ABN2WYN7_9ACTN
MPKDMLSYRDLDQLEFGKLDKAIADWDGIREKFGDMSSGKGEGADAPAIEKQIANATWKGENARRVQKMAPKVAAEVHDAARSARSIHKLLTIARKRLHTHQQDLRDEVKAAKGQDVIIKSDGTVMATKCYTDKQEEKAAQRKVDAVKGRIEKILIAAARTERNLAETLRFLVKDPNDFSGATYNSYKDATEVAGRLDADSAVHLARDLAKAAEKGDLSPTKLARLNELALLQRTNPEFAERFATQMGPEGTLKFWRLMSGDGPEVWSKSGHGKELTRLRDSLSFTLATASRVDSPQMDKWKQGIYDWGPRPVSYKDMHAMHDPVGYQVMSSLMGKGRFDKDFLAEYGSRLRAFDKKLGDEGKAWSRAEWQGTDLDPSSLGRAVDPMTGFLQATSHNPEFATELFANKENADFYLNRDYVAEDPYREDGKRRNAEALGDAMFAAGSGIDPDDPDAKFVEHTGRHNEIFKHVLNNLAEKKNDMMPELRDDMAMLMGNHGDRVYDTMSARLGNGPLNESQVMEVSKQISRTPEGYAILNQSMNEAMVHDIQREHKDPTDAVENSGRAVGFLEEARHRAIGEQAEADKKDAGWNEFWKYMGVAEVSALPVFGPYGVHAANGMFALTKDWTEDEQARIAAEATGQNIDASKVRSNQLEEFARMWREEHGHWAQDREGYITEKGVQGKFADAADHGKLEAKRIVGLE